MGIVVSSAIAAGGPAVLGLDNTVFYGLIDIIIYFLIWVKSGKEFIEKLLF